MSFFEDAWKTACNIGTTVYENVAYAAEVSYTFVCTTAVSAFEALCSFIRTHKDQIKSIITVFIKIGREVPVFATMALVMDALFILI